MWPRFGELAYACPACLLTLQANEAWVIAPTRGKPRGIVHFLGGAFAGAAPQVRVHRAWDDRPQGTNPSPASARLGAMNESHPFAALNLQGVLAMLVHGCAGTKGVLPRAT